MATAGGHVVDGAVYGEEDGEGWIGAVINLEVGVGVLFRTGLAGYFSFCVLYYIYTVELGLERRVEEVRGLILSW